MVGIYLSYSYPNQDIARRLCQLLETEGHGRWFVLGQRWKDLPAGATWYRPVSQEISAAAVLIVLLSRHSGGSEYVRNEVGFALSNQKPLIPIYLDDSPDAGLSELRSYKAVDLIDWDGDITDKRLGFLVDALNTF